MRVILTVTATLSLLNMQYGFTQSGDKIIKLNLYPHFSNPGITIGLEFEKSLGRTIKFSQATRIEYRTITSENPSDNFFGQQNLCLGYAVKYYPFRKQSGKKFQGVFVGIMPSYFVKVRSQYRYGPAIGIPAGYQFVLKSRLTLSLEYTVTFMQNVNNAIPPSNPSDRYFDLFKGFRIGYRF